MKPRGSSHLSVVAVYAAVTLFACSEGSGSPTYRDGNGAGGASADTNSAGAAGESVGGSGGASGSQVVAPPTEPRKDLEQYADRDELDAEPTFQAIDRDESYAHRTEIQYLSGKGFDDAVDWEFMVSAGRNKGVWSTIGVPSNWELYGFGTFSYGRTYMTTEQGRYRTHFAVPSYWKEKRVFLAFEGVMTDTEVWVNGQSAGPIHQGGFYAFQYDVTSLLKLGADNLLEVTVSKHSADDSVNEAERRGDYWVFGGIYRPVMLAAAPTQSIARIAVDARANGHLKVNTVLRELSEPGELTLQLYDENLGPVGAPLVKAVNSGEAEVSLEADYPGVDLWTAETPHRYRVSVQLLTESGVQHEVRENVGFRTIEVRNGDGIYLNGTRLLLKGVNRHSFWPNTGRALNAALSLYDVRLMKRMNVNAIRSSHYPPDQHFLDTCDREGVYVFDELAGWQASYKGAIAAKLVEEMVTHDVNHPSILLWDNGNEWGWNNTVNDDFGLWDPSNRPVIHPGDLFGNIRASHYPSYDELVSQLSGTQIRLMTEFSHAMYDQGGGASLEDYWEKVRSSPVGAGGFIWAMLDEGVNRTDTGIVDTRGNSAPDGIVGPYRQKEGSYDTIRQIWSPVHIVGQPLTSTFDGQLVVENRYQFLSLDTVKFHWQLLSTDYKNATTAVVEEGTRSVSGITPGARGTVDLGLPANWAQSDVLRIEALDAEGNVLTQVSTMTRSAEQSSAARLKLTSDTPAKVVSADGAEAIVVEAGALTYTWAKSTGRLTGVSRSGKAIAFGNGPELLTPDTSTLSAIDVSTEGADVLVTATLSGALQALHWRVYASGWLSLDYSFNLSGAYDYYGVGFDYPEERVLGAAWLGRGPSRVWKNRLQGPTHGVFQKTANDSITGEIWAYPEFCGYYDDVYWFRLETTEVPMHFVMATPSMAFGLLKPKDAAAPLKGGFSYPAKNISFLNGISPIGTFTLETAKLGPHSQPYALAGTYGGRVFMYFGPTSEVPLL